MSPRGTVPEKRHAKRAKVLYVARLLVRGEEHPVKLLDVSPLGAMVETDLVLEAGDDVQFIRSGICLPSQVVWTEDDRAGLEFVDPVRDEEVIRTLAKPLGL